MFFFSPFRLATGRHMVLFFLLGGWHLFPVGNRQELSGEEPEKAPLMAYVGTFSAPLKDTLPTQVDLPPGNGRGIHLFRVDRETGVLSEAGVFESGTSPSRLVVNHDGTRMYSANETDRFKGTKEGTVSSFVIDRKSGQLKLQSTVPSGGAGPTYVSIHPSRRFLLVANYFGGSVSVVPITDNGELGLATDVQVTQGKIGPTVSRNAPPGSKAFSGHDRTHAHMIQSDPSGRFVMHVDLGLDRIYVWKFDAQRGKLTPGDPAFVALPPGDGPRHFAFHPNGRWFYSIQEEGSTLARFDYNAERGRLEHAETVSSLPPGYAGSNFCSEIQVSADGRFLYAGNRLHDSIGIFSIAGNGKLSFVDDEWTRGNYPRSFSFSPGGRFFYVGNQRADHLTLFHVNGKNGKLRFTGKYTPVGNPSHMVFVDLAR
ncbi:MAG: lactonase family protein [Planctomycetota bacterium]|nr:lactonase family protein [Planctomycetota bacterium]